MISNQWTVRRCRKVVTFRMGCDVHFGRMVEPHEFQLGNRTHGYVVRFQDLEVYRKQRMLSRAVFQVTKRFPAEERFSMTDQLRRSSRSIGAQLAESWAKRLYPKHFVSKLTDADGEQLETQHWLQESTDCGYLSPSESAKLIDLCSQIGRMIGAMIAKAETFASAEYQPQDAR